MLSVAQLGPGQLHELPGSGGPGADCLPAGPDGKMRGGMMSQAVLVASCQARRIIPAHSVSNCPTQASELLAWKTRHERRCAATLASFGSGSREKRSLSDPTTLHHQPQPQPTSVVTARGNRHHVLARCRSVQEVPGASVYVNQLSGRGPGGVPLSVRCRPSLTMHAFAAVRPMAPFLAAGMP